MRGNSSKESHRAMHIGLKNSVTSSGGFILVELLLTVGIVGVLASIAIPEFQEYRKRAYDIAAMASLHDLTTATVAYRFDESNVLGAFCVQNDPGSTIGGGGSNCSDKLSGYTANEDVLCLNLASRLVYAACSHSKSETIFYMTDHWEGSGSGAGSGLDKDGGPLKFQTIGTCLTECPSSGCTADHLDICLGT